MTHKSLAWASLAAILMVSLIVIDKPARANEAPAAGLYIDMGQSIVQLPDANCGIRNLAVSYQLEYSEPSKAAFLTAHKPKVQSIVFGTLSDYFATHKTYSFETVRNVLQEAILETFGKDSISEVIVTQVVEYAQ